MGDQQVRQRWMEAANAGDINLLYGCIKDYPKSLDSIDEIPFVDTPLHIAASAGHAHFALEMMRLMPSFGKKLNPQGLSPLGLALQQMEGPILGGQDLRNRITSTIRRLINFDKELIRVKGRESFTPLHYVVENGDVDLLAEFLCACPESIMDRTIRDETALHIAVKKANPDAFQVLLGCLCRIREHHDVLRWKDDEGNTLLHIAVSTAQTQIVKSLLKMKNVDKNAKNLAGRTALDIAIANPGEAEIKEALDHAGASTSASLPAECSFANFFMSPQSTTEAFARQQFYQERELTMEMRNAILVVAVLIATATFQAMLSPPGGVARGGTGDNNNQLTTNENHINATVLSTTTNNNLIPANNVSYINATIFTNTTTTTTNPTATVDPSKQVLLKSLDGKTGFTYGSFFTVFYSLNTACFLASIMTIMFTLQLTIFSALLYLSLFFMILSYGISFVIISPSSFYASTFFVISYAFALVYLLGEVYEIFHYSRYRSQRLQMLLELLERS